jgi:hypothetical protein
MPLTTFTIPEIIYYCVAILFAITAQGAVQGLTLDLFSHTPEGQEEEKPRINLHFFAHLDPISLLVFFADGFGWARVIKVEDSQLKKPKVAWLATGYMSAFTNLLVAVSISTISDILWTSRAFYVVMGLNASVFVYHALVPIPPLAASRIIYALIPPQHRGLWHWYARLGPFILLTIAALERFTDVSILHPITQPLFGAIMRFCTTTTF